MAQSSCSTPGTSTRSGKVTGEALEILGHHTGALDEVAPPELFEHLGAIRAPGLDATGLEQSADGLSRHLALRVLG